MGGLYLATPVAWAQPDDAPPTLPAASEPTASPTTAAPAPATELPSGPEDTAAKKSLSLLEVVQTTLKQHPSIQLADARVAERQAAISAEEGAFDTLFLASAGHQRDHVPVVAALRAFPEQDSTISDRTSLGLGLEWASKWGTRLSPSVTLDRIHQRADGSGLTAAQLVDPFHQARVDLTVTQPLLRGAGATAVASGIEAARLSRDAAKHLVAHTAQTQVFQSVVAYWQWVAATEFFGLLRATEAGALKLREDTKLLVLSDQRPRSDLNLLEGNLANRTRQVHEARNDQLRALFALHAAMGLSVKAIPVARPAESFPDPVEFSNDAELVKQALASRQDLAALRQEVGAVGKLLDAADENTDPALDLSVSVGYAGAVDRDGPDAFFSSAVENIPGVSGGVSLSLELPFENTAQTAVRDVRSAQQQQARISMADLERRLPIDVLSALSDLRLSAQSLEASALAVAQYEKALNDERDRLRAGVGTVIDLVLTQDQLISAQLAHTNDRARYAVALSRLYFEMGALPTKPGEAVSAVTKIAARGAKRGQ